MCDSFLTLVRGVTVIIAIADYQSLFARKLGVGRVMTITLTLTKYARTCWRSVGWMKIYYIYIIKIMSISVSSMAGVQKV